MRKKRVEISGELWQLQSSNNPRSENINSQNQNSLGVTESRLDKTKFSKFECQLIDIQTEVQ